MNFNFQRFDKYGAELLPFDFVSHGDAEPRIGGEKGGCYSCGGLIDQPLEFIDDKKTCESLNKSSTYARHGSYSWVEPGQTATNACLVAASQANSDRDMIGSEKPKLYDAAVKSVTNPRLDDICVCSDDMHGGHKSLKEKGVIPTYARLLQEQQSVEATYNPFGSDPHFVLGLQENSGSNCTSACKVAYGDKNNQSGTNARAHREDFIHPLPHIMFH
jgi:hypothetical protein